jgi:hypothetical protein
MDMKRTFPGLLVFAILLAPACGGGGKEDGDADEDVSPDGDVPDGEADGAAYACVRDPALMDDGRSCGRDEDCPCGTHCRQGLCIHECVQDSDCSGWCDFFGWCRAESDTGLVAPIRTAGGGAVIQVEPGTIGWHAWSPERVVIARALHGDLGEVRVKAGRGLLVSCGEGFSGECAFASIAEGETAQIAVQLNESVVDRPETMMLRVHHGLQVRSVSVATETAPVITPPEPGIYKGQIWINEAWALLAGNESAEEIPLSTSSTLVQIGVKIKLFSDMTLVFEDPSGLLPGAMVFRLDEAGHFDAVDGGSDLSRQVYLGGAESTDDEQAVEVAVAMAGDLKAFGETIAGSFTMTVDGLGLAVVPSMLVDERPRLGWQFSVVRAGDIPTGEEPPEPGGGAVPAFDVTFDRYGDLLPWEEAVAGCGDLEWGSADAAGMAEHILCYGHAGTMSSVPLNPDTGDLTLLGDLKCDDGLLRRTAFTLLTNGDTPSGGIEAQMMLVSCKAEIDRLWTAVQTTTASGAQGLDDLSGCGTDFCTAGEMPVCIDGPQALRALGLGMDTMPRGGWPDRLFWEPASPYAVQLGHRLLQEWIQTHTFVAREQAQASDLLFGGSASDAEAGLETSLKAWDVVLHPRVSGWMMHLPTEVLSTPDYRGLEPDPDAMTEDITQAVGLPVVLLEGLRAQLEAATQLTGRSRFQGTAISPQVARTLRYAAVVSVLAELLHARAALDGEPPWEARWDASREGFVKALGKLLSESKALAAGINPLGITDEDLPLYHGSSNPAAAGERFTAISSYLLDNWAASAVQSAEDARAEAVTAYAAMLDRQLQKEMLADKPDRIAEIKRMYGEKILTLCGNPYGYTSDEVLDSWTDLSADNCFMNPASSSCQFDENELFDKLTADDLAYQLCYLTELRMRLGDRAKLSDEDINAQITGLANQVAALYDESSGEYWKRLDFTGFSAVAENMWTAITTGQGALFYELGKFYDLRIAGDEDANAFVQAEAICRAQVPDGTPPADLVAGLESSPLDRPDCYQGSLGELALASRDAAHDIEVANSELQDYMDAYENRVRACTIQEEGLAGLEAAEWQLSQIEAKVGQAQGTIDGLLGVVNTIFKSVQIGFGKDGPSVQLNPGEVSTMVTGWVSKSTSGVLAVNELKALHATFVSDFREQIQRAQCFNDAEMQLVATDTQARRIEASQLDLAQALLKFSNAKQELKRLIAEGKRRVEGEQARQNTSLVNDIWSDLYELEQSEARGKIEAYRRDMRLAQIVVYLAVRAVEYEFQVTSALRDDVLAATTPAELEDVVDQLKAETGTVTIAGQSPEGLHVVFSLKDNLLQLASMEEWPEGEHRLTDTERFRLMLSSPRYASYDAGGVYRGQLIPFSLAPLGTLDLGDPGTIGLLTGSDCAERTWSVNLVIQGPDIVDDGSTFTRVDLMHRNTFYSQWCLEPGEDQGPMQSASVRPSVNLFKDPVWGSDYGETDTTQSDYTRTRIEAYFNKTREEFEAEDYQQGAKEELATRALYGEYALFFPAEFLATESTDGLHLDRIEDILLRIDYVSAAKVW